VPVLIDYIDSHNHWPGHHHPLETPTKLRPRATRGRAHSYSRMLGRTRILNMNLNERRPDKAVASTGCENANDSGAG
jgi:hypothetical protein